MDLSILNEYFVVIVVLACLVVGYIIKHASFFKWVKNDDIPAILAIVGAVISSLVNGLSVESVIVGAFMGLASTGVHQTKNTSLLEAFSKFIENFSKTE